MSLERLETLRRDMKKCVRCSLCKLVPLPTIQQTRFTSACPPVDEYHFHAYSGGGMQVMALALLDGRIQVDATWRRSSPPAPPAAPATSPANSSWRPNGRT